MCSLVWKYSHAREWKKGSKFIRAENNDYRVITNHHPGLDDWMDINTNGTPRGTDRNQAKDRANSSRIQRIRKRDKRTKRKLN